MEDDPTVRLPPLSNWKAQTYGYGFLLDRSLAPDYNGTLSIGDIVAPNPEDLHMLNLNPQSIAYSEPIATEVTFTQGGGKNVESRGGVLKSCVIRGTTGLLPPVAPHATHMSRIKPISSSLDPTAPAAFTLPSDRATGFYEFYRLRQLFRKFMAERRAGQFIFMHWLDFKGDEFWSIEPKRFDLERGRFTYSYSIQFDLIEPSEKPLIEYQFGGAFSDVITVDRSRTLVGSRSAAASPGKFGLLNGSPLSSPLDTATRRTLQRFLQLATSGSAFVTRFTVGVVAVKMQAVLRGLGLVQQFFANLASIRRALLDLPTTLFSQLYSALQGLSDAINDGATPAAFKRDLNEWYLEVRFMLDSFTSYNQGRFGQTPGQMLVAENEKWTTPRAQTGTYNNLMTEPTGSTGTPAVNPFMGASGFDLIGDVRRMSRITAMQAEDVLTGESIWDVAFRLLGDVNRFVDLVILNKLQQPYIVASSFDKPPGTIAWGEQILIPVAADTASLTTAEPIDPGTRSFSGTVSLVGTTTSLIDDDVASGQWREHEWVGYTVEITSGAALGDKRVITANTEDTLTINRAWSAALTIGTTYKIYLEVFTRRLPITPESRAYGRDILVAFALRRGVVTDGTLDCMLGPNGDLAMVDGSENFEQAITVRLNTPQGANLIHPTYGVADVIGRAVEPNMMALYTFYTRRGLLSDPRVQAVERPQFVTDGGALYFTVTIQPVRVQRTALFRVAV